MNTNETQTGVAVVNASPRPQSRRPRTAPTRLLKDTFGGESITTLVQAPLKELFWGIPESKLLEEAKQRIELLIGLAAAAEPLVLPEMGPAPGAALEPV